MPRNFLNWVDRDSRIITIVRGIRTLGQAAITLLLALYLSALGFSLIRIGVVLSIDVAGTFFLALLVAMIGNRFGRRHLLATIMFLAAVASLGMAFTSSFPVILVAIFFGSFTAGAGAGGPLQPLEVSSIAEVSPADCRTRLMGIMFIVGTAAAAFGALLVALPAFTQQLFHLDKITSFRVVFILYAVIQLVSALLYLRLSSLVEAKVIKRQWTNPFKLKSRKRIFTLTALFAVDGFGGALVGQSLVALWFSTKFGLNLNSLSLVFFFSSLLSAASTWVSVRIAERIGLLKTMVFTHIPSSVFLIAAAFSPFAWLAISFYQLRSVLSQMDVPARESYTMAVVEPDERVAMAGIGGVGRSGASIIGPAAGTALWNAVGSSAPFVGCGIFKVSYDLLIYTTFRNVKPPEEDKHEIEQNGQK